MAKLINRLAMWSAIASVGIAIFGWIFHLAFYWVFSTQTGHGVEAHQSMELLIFYGVLFFASLAMVFGVLLILVPSWRNIRLAVSVLVTSLVTPPLYYIIQGLLAGLGHA